MKNYCSQCGICCKLFLINLSEKEYLSGKYKTQFKKFQKFQKFEKFEKITSIGANILEQKKDGSCIYLKKNLCSIHKTRPQVCQDFFCNTKTKKFQKMIKLINDKRSLLKSKTYFFYMVRCHDNSLYCGQTNNLEKRIKEHNSNSSASAKYTRAHKPVKLVYSEKYKTLQMAMKREYEVKQWPKIKKEKLIKT